MSDLNADILDDDENTLAIEADEEVQYEPDTDSAVVAVEPKVIEVGRGIRKKALRAMRNERTV